MKPNKTFIAGVIFLAIILGVTYVFAQTPEEKARQQVIKEQAKYDEIELDLQVQREILDQALQVHKQYIEAKEQELEEYKSTQDTSQKPLLVLTEYMEKIEEQKEIKEIEEFLDTEMEKMNDIYSDCYISGHNDKNHEEYGGMYAIDYHCGKKGVPSDVHFSPEFNEYVIVAIGEDPQLGNYIIVKHGDYRFVYGHTVTSRKVGEYIKVTNTNNVLGQENKSGAWDGYHFHVEKWKCNSGGSFYNNECVNISFEDGSVNPKSEKLLKQRGWYIERTGKCSAKESFVWKGKKYTTDVGMIQYAHDISGGDMDFIGTISQESLFVHDMVGDGGDSFGYCQIHGPSNPEMQKEYRNLASKYDMMSKCYHQYKNWVDAGIIEKRLHGYNVRKKGLEKLQISCK